MIESRARDLLRSAADELLKEAIVERLRERMGARIREIGRAAAEALRVEITRAKAPC